MIRVPLASASAGVIGLAGVPYRVRRGFVPQVTRHVDSTSRPYARRVRATVETAPAIVEPAFRAPWGEIERQLPYVVITTQPWPEEWWRAPMHDAIARATDAPSERMLAATLAGPGPDAAAIAVPIESSPRINVVPMPDQALADLTTLAMPDEALAGRTTPDLPSSDLPSSDLSMSDLPAPAPDRDDSSHSPTAAAPRRRTRRNEAPRRGALGRLVLVAVGLVLSLIAVESASRRRR